MDRELDRMEQKGDDYHEKVRAGYLELVRIYDNVVGLDGSKPVDAVFGEIIGIVSERLRG